MKQSARQYERRTALITLLVCLSYLFGAPAAAQPTIYWSNTYAGSLQKTTIGTGLVEDLVEGFVERPQNLSLDLAGQRLYWSLELGNPSPATAVLQRSTLDGSLIDNLLFSAFCDPFCPVTAMAFDYAANTAYWATWDGVFPATFSLYTSAVDGSGVQFIATGENVILDIEIDTGSGAIYWIEAKLPGSLADHVIRRAGLDGSNPEELVNVFDGKPPSEGHIALDAPGGKIVWVTNNRGIRRVNLDGSQLEDLVPVEGDSTFIADFAVDAAGGKMYWSATYGGITTFPNGVIHRADLDGSNIETLVSLTPAAIGSIALDLSAVVSNQEDGVLPERTDIGTPYPNPSLARLSVPFRLSEPGDVSIDVFDMLGRHRKTVRQGSKAAGDYVVTLDTSDLPSGVYALRITTGGTSDARTFVVRR